MSAIEAVCSDQHENAEMVSHCEQTEAVGFYCSSAASGVTAQGSYIPLLLKYL